MRTAREVIANLKSGTVTDISLDHDLGDDEKYGTGYEVASYIEEAAVGNEIPRLRWRVHSANPIGVVRMTVALQNADSAWDGWKRS